MIMTLYIGILNLKISFCIKVLPKFVISVGLFTPLYLEKHVVGLLFIAHLKLYSASNMITKLTFGI